MPVTQALRQVLAWYFDHAYGRVEGLGVLPWYCDPSRSGRFAVAPDALAAGDTDTLFRLFVAFSMFQARRDTVILAQQRAMADQDADVLACAQTIEQRVTTSSCAAFTSVSFEQSCTVGLRGGHVDCMSMMGQPCHVKDATRALKRTGDMGKIPSSAWLRSWAGDALTRTLAAIAEAAREARGELLVQHFSTVHRVGQKLATMFVAALSTPALAPGLTPWYPMVDGNDLLVIDTHVARVLNTLGCTETTYRGRAQWLRRYASDIDLTAFHPNVPRRSPRLVQQALFTFCSRSNRTARGDPCATADAACAACSPELCPFVSPASGLLMEGD